VTFSILIPARYRSTRLEGKPLRVIAGKPLIEHVHDRAVASGAEAVFIATDDPRIEAVARGFGARVCMTSRDHPSGTDRIAEAIDKLGIDDDRIVVNLQGDEPLIPVSALRQVAQNLADHADAVAATLCEPLHSADLLFDPHVVKVVTDRNGFALYFTRAAVPWDREAFVEKPPALPDVPGHYRHIGLYAYRAGFLRAFVGWPPCKLEQTEALEQLRILWYGHKIHVAQAVEPCPAGVDRESDVARLEALLASAMP
jgi:3-deoxy-manno-octulosonate cytidylyltransferase (CMP-KDO synthetase)